jgi:hypothetical protein
MRLIVFFSMMFGACSAFAEPAIVLTGHACWLPDFEGGVIYTTDTRTVMSRNKNGNSKVVCKAEGVFPPSNEVFRYNFENTGMCCNAYFPTQTANSDDWELVINKKGDVSFRCSINDYDPDLHGGDEG